MNNTIQNNTTGQGTKLAIWFSIQGDLRFLSHRDTMRLWQRCISRTRLPVKFSQGFNPHMKLSLPVPRSVGMSALSELLLVDFESPVETENVGQILTQQLPDNVQVVQVSSVPNKVSSLPQSARYHFILADEISIDPIRKIIDLFHEAASCCVERPARGRHLERTLELKEHITHLSLEEGYIDCQVAISPKATPRIDEILQRLELETPRPIVRIDRMAVKYHNITMMVAPKVNLNA